MTNATGSRDVVRVGLVAFGVVELAAGLWMAVSPGTFFEEVGPYGIRNDHYIRDIAAFSIALGAALLLAVPCPRWHSPVLAVAAIYFALHAVSHWIDVGGSDPEFHGPLDAALITVGAAILTWLHLKARGRE